MELAEQEPAIEHTGVRTSSYTAGSQATANAIVGAFYLAVVLCVVLSVLAFMKPATVAIAAEGGGSQPLSAATESTGAFALGFVGAWLSASSEDFTSLQNYVAMNSSADLPSAPTVYKDLAVASITPAESSDLVSVVIAGNVQEVGEKKQAVWPRRYFLVTINTGLDSMGVVGLPAPIAAPVKSEQGASLVYTEAVVPTDAAAQAVTSFLAAYVAGQGDMNRYLSPSSTLTPIVPAPFTAVKVQSLQANVNSSGTPRDGSQLKVLAKVQLTSTTDQKLISTYALTLVARAERWEISSLDLTPAEAEAKKSPVSTVDPTKGN